MNINSERESHVLETPAGNLCRKSNFTSPKEELKNLRLKNPNLCSIKHKFCKGSVTNLF